MSFEMIRCDTRLLARRTARVRRAFKAILLTLGLTVLAFFLPPLRNALTPRWPRVWTQLTTYQVIKMHLVLLGWPEAPITPVYCSGKPSAIPGKPSAFPGDPEGTSSLTFVPYALQGRAEDEVLYRRAQQWMDASPARKARYFRYLPKMTLYDKARLLCTWRVLDSAFRAANLTYFLVEGSLLGAYRHRGIIPWDDDLDIAMDGRELDRIRRVLSCIPGYSLHVQDNMHWKFYPANSSSIPAICPEVSLPPEGSASSGCRGGRCDTTVVYTDNSSGTIHYPFVDIFLYTSDDTYTWALTGYVTTTMAFKNVDIFPLASMPFEGFAAPVPRRSKEIVELMFDAGQCLSTFHDHKMGKALTDIDQVACRELEGMYPLYNV